MRDSRFYEKFATEWIEAWNSHDLKRILSHYDESFAFTSPFLAKFIPDSGGKLKGKEAVGAYWSKALAAYPELHFELIVVLKGVENVALTTKGAAESCAPSSSCSAITERWSSRMPIMSEDTDCRYDIS